MKLFVLKDGFPRPPRMHGLKNGSQREQLSLPGPVDVTAQGERAFAGVMKGLMWRLP